MQFHRSLVLLSALLSGVLVLSGCTADAAENVVETDKPHILTTTGILADLASNVAGDRAEVIAMVPPGADPHSYEPSLRNVRDVVYADAVFTNYLLLEEQSIIRTIDANIRDGVPNVSLAESAVKYAAEVIPLIEDVSLDTAWLGVRSMGSGEDYGADRTSEVLLSGTGMRGTGELHAYLTGTFGDITQYFDSHDGFDAGTGYWDDTMTLPPDAHTHLSWAFTESGVYELDLEAKIQPDHTSAPVEVAAGTVVFAVGVSPHDIPGREQATVIDAGHSDITVNLDEGSLQLLHETTPSGQDEQRARELLDLEEVVIEVPTKAMHEVPGEPSYRFLGTAGSQIYQLPQAVLGKHVHGEIDPHLWQNVRNSMAYVQIIRDTMIQLDPEGASEYRNNAAEYLAELEALDEEVRSTIATIPSQNRTLITTHDAFGYLAKAYDLTVAGFVTPNPATEPSMANRRKLTQTIRDLEVPAVFLEPNLAARSSTLQQVAEEQGIDVCPIYGDAFDENVENYVDMMRANATSLARCLG